MKIKKNLKTCENGHKFYKSSDCPVCPTCEKTHLKNNNFLDVLSAPARRAFETENISTLEKLSSYSEEELLKLHGFGKASLPVLKNELVKAGLSFRK